MAGWRGDHAYITSVNKKNCFLVVQMIELAHSLSEKDVFLLKNPCLNPSSMRVQHHQEEEECTERI